MKALVIFGSKARHDSEPDSDVDLLGVYDGDSVIPKAIDNVHLFLYPEKHISHLMKSGDLFALHLVKESVTIYGNDVIDNLFSQFTYKNNYVDEICTARELAMSIINSYQDIKDTKIANKKLSWCVRTSIIALSANNREPVFSKKRMSEYIVINGITSKDIEIMINFKKFSSKLSSNYISKVIEFFSFFNHYTGNVNKDFIFSNMKKINTGNSETLYTK
ncbi:hypothetical protein DNY06_19790 [Salmonella enterica subsp. enterica serovar Javiana]|nr:hypothetical protein [Salmonella enterica subsp. enterica serovar Javiana]